MNFRRKFLIIVTFFLLKTQANCQEFSNDLNFVNIEDGISKTAISTIIQDHYGFIWIGTNGTGIYRYDGIEYTSYKHNANDSISISSSMIFCTYLDKSNRLWVGTESGLNVYDRENDRFRKICLTDRTKDDCDWDMAVSGIVQDSDGILFVSVFEKGLFKLRIADQYVEEVPSIGFGKSLNSELFKINTLEVDRDGRVYAGTNKGLMEYDPITKTLRPSMFLSGKDSESLQESIQSLEITENNDIWVGSSSSGLYQIDREDEEHIQIIKIPITQKRILSLITLPDETLLCGTENDGIFHVDEDGRVLKNYVFDKMNKNSIRSNSIWSLFLDNNDRIWMGYYNRGIGLYDKLYDKFKHIESLPNNPNSLQVSTVTGIIQDQSDNLWISMDGGGIDIYDPDTSKFKHINTKNSNYSGLVSDDIQTIFIDSRQNLWAGSWSKGIFFLKKGTTNFVNFTTENTNGELLSNSVLSFAEDTKGRIWIGTFFGGLLSYDYDKDKIEHHKSNQFLQYNIHKSFIRKVLVDHNDNIWVGTTTGLFKIKEEEQNNWSIVSVRDKLPHRYKTSLNANHILSIYQSSDKKLWFGTRGEGLCQYNPDQNIFTWFNQEKGLQEENVSAIIESIEGDIWISGNKGLHKIDRNSDTIVNYNINDGLLSNDFNFNVVHRDSKGNLYFGNYNGIDYFNPKNLKTNRSKPNLHLTGFKLFNKNVLPNNEDSPLKKVIAETDSISLSHKQSVFTIEYTGINYTRPEKNQYAYYLEGLEDTWNYVGNTRSATYTNLDHGNYTFKLKAANNDGVWNDTPLTLKLTILPPWWKTNWAILSYIILFLLGIYLLNKLTQDRIKEKQLIENEREKRLKEEELNNKKLQFFTNISHEFRTPLTLIINPLIDIINNKTYNLPDEVKEKHITIHKNTHRLSRLIDELMDFRKLELNKLKIKAQEIEVISFIEDIASYFSEEAQKNNITLSIENDVSQLKVWVDRSMLEKIIFNLLSNAFKVTPEEGKVLLEIYIKNDLSQIETNEYLSKGAFEICVSDTGPGLEKEQLDKIFERFYQVDNLNKWYYGGTGIGLEVVRNFVELHSGKIEVNSQVGIGTSFKVILPLGKSHFQEGEIRQKESDAASHKIERVATSWMQEIPKEEVDKESKKARLLIVEDNIDLRNYLKQELSDQYKIFIAFDGQEGLDKAKKEIPDIIITDVIMPKMDGFAFCSKIKEDIQTSHIPVLMLTAKAMQDDKLKGIDAGADAYLSKPFDIRVLKSTLAQLLSSRQLLFNKYFSAIADNDININTTSLDKEFIQKVLNYINENINDPDLGVELLASQLHLSRSQFYRKVKTLTGQTANQFLRNIRLQRAKQILEKGNTNISEVCYQVGFSSPSYFTKCFKNHFGVLPTEVEKEKS